MTSKEAASSRFYSSTSALMERAGFLGDEKSPWGKLTARRVFGIPVVVVAAGLLAAVLFVNWGASAAAPLAFAHDPNYAPGPRNATLGFGAIILLTLKERTDRQDGMSLISSLSGISITHTAWAVKGDDIVTKALPFGNSKLAPAYLGSWRTHMDALKYVIDNRIETALLLEDDVDWDVRIKDQMAAFSKGMATSTLRNMSSQPVNEHYPYGIDWDIMHLGSAYLRLASQEPYNTLRSTYVDADRPVQAGCPKDVTPSNLYCWDPLLEQLKVSGDSRAILPSFDSVGLPAIAVTYEGAQRILYQLSWVKLETTVDWSISRLMQRGLIAGWTVLPPLFTQWKVGGNHDSDLDGNKATFFGDVKSSADGFSFGLERSIRKALTGAFAPAPDRPGRWTPEYWVARGQNVF